MGWRPDKRQIIVEALSNFMVEDYSMSVNVNSQYLNLLKNRINLREIPFSERGSRLLIFQSNDHFTVRLAERWFKREGQLSAYRKPCSPRQ